MAGAIQFTFDINGKREFDRALIGVKAAATNMEPVFIAVAQDFRKTNEEIFSKSGNHEGLAKWTPLSEGYSAWKQKNYGDLPILTLTGDLRNSLTEENAEGAILRITEDNLEIGTEIEYAIYHQEGRGNLPERRPLRLSEEQKKRWGKILAYGLRGAIDTAASQRYRF